MANLLAYSELIKLLTLQATKISIRYVNMQNQRQGTFLTTHYWNNIKNKKANQPARFEPKTSQTCFITAVPQPLPKIDLREWSCNVSSCFHFGWAGPPNSTTATAGRTCRRTPTTRTPSPRHDQVAAQQCPDRKRRNQEEQRVIKFSFSSFGG